MLALCQAMVLLQGQFCTPGTQGNAWTPLRLSLSGGGVTAPRGWRPGTVLNVISARDATQQRMTQPKCHCAETGKLFWVTVNEKAAFFKNAEALDYYTLNQPDQTPQALLR